jgi:hypothetical protein
MAVARLFAILAFALFATAGAALAEHLPSKVDVRADAISFFPYSNETLLAAEGHVVLRTGRHTFQCDSMRWDLLKNLLTLAGNVRVVGGPAEIDGAAYRRDLNTGNAYVMQVDPVPATYAVTGDDLSTAVEGPAPTGTFGALDIDGQRPFMRGRHAIVTPNAAVRMAPVEFPTGAGPALKLPTYLYTLVQNPYISESAAPAASFDQPYSLFGSPASLTAAHIRYDSYNGITAAIDERLVDRNKAYVVASILPFRDKQFDILSYQVIQPGLQQTLSGTHTFGVDPNNTLSYRLEESGKYLIETFLFSDFDASNSTELDVSTYDHTIKHLLGYQFKASYGYDHNYGGYPYTNDFRIGGYGLVTSPSLTLFGTGITAKYEYSVTSYDYPHEVTTGTATITGSRPLGKKVQIYGQVEFEQSNNRYRYLATGQRALGLPPIGSPYITYDGTPYPGYFAYTGLSTYRSYEVQTTVNGHGDNRVQTTFTYNDDFPQYHGFGPPPLFASIDVIQRITPALRIEVGRSYSFGWAGQYLSPQYTFAISP